MNTNLEKGSTGETVVNNADGTTTVTFPRNVESWGFDLRRLVIQAGLVLLALVLFRVFRNRR